MLPNNIDIQAFKAGYTAFQKKAGIVDFGKSVIGAISNPIDTVNKGVEGYLGDRIGARMQPTINSMQQAGLKFDRDSSGLPINFDANQSVNNIGKNYISNLGNQVSEWAGNQWNQIKSSPMDWAKNNPWTAGGAAVLGGGLLYGGGKALGLFGSGNRAAARPSAYGVPQYRGGPQAIEKYSGFNPMMQTSLRFPMQVAEALPRKAPRDYAQEEQPQAYEPNFHTDDAKLQKLLQEPQMRSYLIKLLSNG